LGVFVCPHLATLNPAKFYSNKEVSHHTGINARQTIILKVLSLLLSLPLNSSLKAIQTKIPQMVSGKNVKNAEILSSAHWSV
jgi:hypothetical protein